LGDCTSTWDKLLAVAGAPDEWRGEVAKLVAEGSCPQSPAVAALSAKHKAEPGPSGAARTRGAVARQLKAASPLAPRGAAVDAFADRSPAALVALLEALDGQLLGGALRRLANLVGCPQAHGYNASALARRPRADETRRRTAAEADAAVAVKAGAVKAGAAALERPKHNHGMDAALGSLLRPENQAEGHSKRRSRAVNAPAPAVAAPGDRVALAAETKAKLNGEMTWRLPTPRSLGVGMPSAQAQAHSY
jgi:hypothetical protein